MSVTTTNAPGRSSANGSGRETRASKGQDHLRVALVSGSYNYIKDGIALTLNRLVDFLLRQGIEVLVFAPVGPNPAFEPAGTVVPVASVPLPLRPEYRVALGMPGAARQRFREFRPDIVHIAVPDLLGRSALKAARELNVPVVASYHTRYETYLRHYGLSLARPLLEKYLRGFYGSCRELYVPSESMAAALRADVPDVAMHLWSRGVDAARFNPAKRSPAWRTRFGIADDEFVVTFVSRLVREKQLATLADVLLKLKASGTPHRSVIVGEGPERQKLQRQLRDAVFTGFLDGEDLAQAYASSDVFLFPSDTESFGNVTLEAMASGLPTVCADATGSRSLVLPGTTGFLVPPRDSDGFVSAVAQLAGDHAVRARFGAAARERSLTFGWDEPMRDLLGRYRALLQ
jgi:glycosyltransferase involved in cell wall biosynthesis